MENKGYCDDDGITISSKNNVLAESRAGEPTRIPPLYDWKSTLSQCFATWVYGLAYVNLGLMYTIPTIVSGKVENAKSGLSLNEEEVSWYCSLLPISQPIGCLLGGFLQNYIGRTHGLLLMNVSSIASWILLYKSMNVKMLYLSSVLMGISIGFSETPSITYVCEIAIPKLRGLLVTYHTSNVILGLVLTFLLTSFVSWRTACLYCIGLSVFSILMLFFVPDSPIWLLNKGRTTEAIKALRWLRGWVPETHVMVEFEELNRYVKNSYSENTIDRQSVNDPPEGQSFKISYLLETSTLRPFIMLLCFESFGNAASLQAAKNYYIIIFDRLNLSMDSNSICLLNGVAMLFGSLTCASMVRSLGKRLLSLGSMISSSMLTLLLGFYIAFHSELHLSSTIFIVIFVMLGFTQTIGICCTIPWVMLGEVYPIKSRSVATGITGAAYYVSLFVYFKTYYYFELWLTTQGTFMLYGAIGIIGFFYVYVFMPETEGKTMTEIAELFKDGARYSCSHFRRMNKNK